jgi:uncharacterized protein (DUF1919 family)
MKYEDLFRKKAKGPYDSSLEENMPMYDNLPYICDVTLCNRDTINMESGNIIKYYRYTIGEAFEIDPNVDKNILCK